MAERADERTADQDAMIATETHNGGSLHRAGSDVRRKFSEWCEQIKSNHAFCVDMEISYEKFVTDLFVIHFLNTRGCSMTTARLHAIDFLAAEQRTSPSETVDRENAEAISAPSPGNQSQTNDATRHPNESSSPIRAGSGR